jgi:hypothetical protein
MNDCKALLTAYNYSQAKVLMAVYGRADSKGPVLIAEDENREFFMIDFSKADEKDMRKTMATWFSTPPLNGTVVSETLWSRLGKVVCGMTKSATTELATANPDPSKAGTFFDVGKNVFKNVNVYAIGSLIIAKTFNGAVCPAQQAA